MESELEIVYVGTLDEHGEHGKALDEDDVRELAELFRRDFSDIRTTKAWVYFGTGEGFEPAALQLIVDGVLLNVLANLIVLGGAKVWGVLSRAARKARKPYPPVGAPPSLAITVRRPDAAVQFTIWPTLAPEMLPEVIGAISTLLDGVPEDKCVEFWFRAETRTWSEPYELSETGTSVVREAYGKRRRRRRRHRK